jgi:hypothetical protein
VCPVFPTGVTVQKVVSSFGGCLIFRRRLWGDLAREWCKLLDIIHGTNLSPGMIELVGL